VQKDQAIPGRAHLDCARSALRGAARKRKQQRAAPRCASGRPPASSPLPPPPTHLFPAKGWVSGTGGGISVRAGADRIVMAPSGVQKERMAPSDMYVLDGAGAVVQEPAARPPPYPAPKLSECSPLFMAVRRRAVAFARAVACAEWRMVGCVSRERVVQQPDAPDRRPADHQNNPVGLRAARRRRRAPQPLPQRRDGDDAGRAGDRV
jgi:hypothetical protein